MEPHKTTQSHANGTTMGWFPRLTPVRLSPQVPDHMAISTPPGAYSLALSQLLMSSGYQRNGDTVLG